MQKLKDKTVRRQLAVIMPFMGPITATAALFCCEWIHRGSLDAAFWTQSLPGSFMAFALTWLLELCLYHFTAALTGLPALGVGVTGLFSCVPAAVTYFKLKLRGEPFFPWDISQAREAVQVVGKAGVQMQTSMWLSLVLFAALILMAAFAKPEKQPVKKRAVKAGISLLCGLAILGVFLSPALSLKVAGIRPDMWMQNRYYRTYGVPAAFLTNIQTLNVDEPENYSEEAVNELVAQAKKDDSAPIFPGSYRAMGHREVKQPNIIYVMDEAFWDVAELEEYGVQFDRPITPNLQRLKKTSAFGRAYSPSFGGGTCDVEFEALTGYSTEFLPGGCKPFQQHVTHPMMSMAQWLKEQGYNTLAIHCFWEKFWSRNTAYPNLGFDDFISLEDFENPEKKRFREWKNGIVTDAEMARKVIEQWENRDTAKPLFMHAVTMQNHTNYDPKNYPEEELVKILEAPASISNKTLGALQDFATGCKEADDMLGVLTEYFSQVEEPVILVFWGDHYNPIGSGYEVYNATGYAGGNDSGNPRLHQMPLLIWSNYWDEPVNFGTVGAYQISPTVMQLYGLEMPPLFKQLSNQLSVYRTRTRGVTVWPDGSTDEKELTGQAEEWFDKHWMLQYDLMFGEEYAKEAKVQQKG